ncbi:MAG TPA: MFS transporter [Actinomycetota bacterium]
MRLRREEGTPRAVLFTPAFLLVVAITLVYFLSVGVVLPVLPRYVQGPLASGSVAVGLVTGAFGIGAVASRPFAGRVSDRKGRRPLIVAGAALVAASVFAFRFTGAVAPLLFLRLLNGVGEAFFFVGVASMVNDLAPQGRRGEAVSHFSLAVFTGLGAGPVIGEWLLGPAPGRFWLVWLVAAVMVLASAALGLAVPSARPVHPPATEQPTPLVHRAALLPGLVLASGIWGVGGFLSFVPLHALRLGMDGARLPLAVYSAIIISFRSLGARVPDRLGPRRTTTSSLAASASGLLVMALWADPAGLYAGTILLAVGQALCFPALMTLAVEAAPPSERGAVVGTFTAFFDLAFSLGAVSLGGVASAYGYRGAFAGGALAAATGLVFLVPRIRRLSPPVRPADLA